jgi:hypothetical protein
VDECEQRCLKLMEERLVALGASQGTWQARKANQRAPKLASVLLLSVALWLTLASSAKALTVAMFLDEDVVRLTNAGVVDVDARNVVEAAFEKRSIQTVQRRSEIEEMIIPLALMNMQF